MTHTAFSYPQTTKSKSENTFVEQFYSTNKEEIAAAAAGYKTGQRSSNGTLSNVRLYPDKGFWYLELTWSSTTDGSSVEPPGTEVGAKSVSVKGSLIPMPLESHDDYEARWNHYLFAKTEGSVPEWWATATNTILSETLSQSYAWGDSLSELPTTDGKRWIVLKDPTKPGVQSYDFATYTMTESINAISFENGWALVSSRLNTIVTPYCAAELDGTWKCDDASVSYNGKIWIASFSYTLGEWDEDLYGD